jgi:hypothetical protein
VIDAVHLEQVERLVDVGGWAFFAGVRDGEQTLASGAREHSREFPGRMTRFRRIEPDRADRVPVKQHLVERAHRVLRR